MQIRVIMDNDAAIKALANFGLKKAPKIVAKTLNQTAEAVTNQLQRNIKRQFILRSKFTLRSTVSPCARPYKALNKASGRSIARMFSRAGSASPYLWKQEDGGIFAAKKGGAYPVATTKSRVSGSLRRAVRKAYRLPLQSLTDGEYGEIGDAFIGVPKGGNRKRGLYKRTSKALIKLRSLSAKNIRIKPRKFFARAVAKYGTPQFIDHKFSQIFNSEMRRKNG